MYNLKKVIASICVIAMMLTTVAFGATYSDVAEDSAYYEAVETLTKLGIAEGKGEGAFEPEASVTRAEMATFIARIQGFENTASGSAVTPFKDVPASHWASGYIANAAGMGIINGYGDGNFGPEDPVLYEQAVKMVMATLDYTPYANENGGYPAGYLAAANRYDVSLAVSNATAGTEANRGTIAQLLANALDTPLMAQVEWSTDGVVKYEICDGKDNRDYKTLMSENLGYVKLRGVVVENAFTDLDDAKEIKTDEVETIKLDVADTYDTNNKDFETAVGNEITLLAGDTDIADFLGQSVIVYVKEVTGDKYEVISVAVDTARNSVLTMDLTQYNAIDVAPNNDSDPDTNDGRLSYYKSATAKTATQVVLDDDVKVVYNFAGNQTIGTVLGGYVADNGATLYGGSIKLIDNNDAKGYDVIFVEVAETAVVDEAEEDTVAFKTSTGLNSIDELEVDADDTTKVVKILKDGEEVAVADLAEWDTLSIIAAASNANYIVAEVITNSVVGSVGSMYDSVTSDTTYGYSINGAKYDIATGAYGVAGLTVGDGGTFYIDKYGKIAAFNEDSALATGVAANYGYITAIAADTDTLTGQTVILVQMVTADGIESFEVKKNAKLNYDTNEKETEMDAANLIDADNADSDSDNATGADTYQYTYTPAGGSATTSTITLVGTVVKYTKNSAGLVTEITTADYDDKFKATSGFSAGSYEFDADNSRLKGAGYVDADSIVFCVKPGDVKASYVGTLADLEDAVDYDVDAMYFDKKADDNNIIVIDITNNAVSPKTGLAVITGLGDSATEEGEAIKSLSFFLDGKEVSADTIAWADVTKTGFGTLTVGDIVKVNMNGNGDVVAITMVYDFADPIRTFNATTLSSSAFAFTEFNNATGAAEVFAGGQVAAYTKSSTLASVPTKTAGSTANVEYKLSQADNVYVIDINGRGVDIDTGSASSYKCYDALYTNDGDVDVTIGNNAALTGQTVADAMLLSDYVFVRAYEGKVKDVVIVKGLADVKIKD